MQELPLEHLVSFYEENDQVENTFSQYIFLHSIINNEAFFWVCKWSRSFAKPPKRLWGPAWGTIGTAISWVAILTSYFVLKKKEKYLATDLWKCVLKLRKRFHGMYAWEFAKVLMQDRCVFEGSATRSPETARAGPPIAARGNTIHQLNWNKIPTKIFPSRALDRNHLDSSSHCLEDILKEKKSHAPRLILCHRELFETILNKDVSKHSLRTGFFSILIIAKFLRKKTAWKIGEK